MSDRGPVNRRDVLLALGATGAASAGAGVGSFGAFLDRESTGTTFQAGGVDLKVHYDGNEYLTADSGGVGDGPEITLPDLTDDEPVEAKFCFEVRGNPAYVWLCPGIGVDLCSTPLGEGELLDSGHTVDETLDPLGEYLDLTLAYCDVDVSNSPDILPRDVESVCDVLDMYENGIPLDGEARYPVEPGEQVPFQPTGDFDRDSNPNPCLCLGLEATGTLPAGLGAANLAFNPHFVAVQARHNDGEEGPCETIVPDSDVTTGISFVAFCSDDGQLSGGDVSFTVTDRNEEGEAIELEWTSDVEIDHVVLKSGIGAGSVPENHDRSIEVFSYDSATSGTVAVGEGDPTTERVENQPCLEGETGVKFEFG